MAIKVDTLNLIKGLGYVIFSFQINNTLMSDGEYYYDFDQECI